MNFFFLSSSFAAEKFSYAYCAEGEFSKVHLYDEMIHYKGFSLDFVTGFPSSLVTYNALIHGLCFSGMVEEALGILRGMAKMGLSLDYVSYSTVISGFCSNREMRKAYELKVEMDEKSIRFPDAVVYSSLMQGLSDEVTLTSLINAYCAEGEEYKALVLFDEMNEYGSLEDDVFDRINRIFDSISCP